MPDTGCSWGWIYPGVIDTLHRVLRWKEDVVFPVTHRQQEDHCPPHTIRNVTTHVGTRLRARSQMICMCIHVCTYARYTQAVSQSRTRLLRSNTHVYAPSLLLPYMYTLTMPRAALRHRQDKTHVRIIMSSVDCTERSSILRPGMDAK